MVPNRYEQYFDISGRVAETTAGQDFVTVAGVCVLPDAVAGLRKRCGAIPKWSDCSRSDAKAALQLLQGPVLMALAIRVRKAQPAWGDFWTRAKTYHREAAQREGDSKGVAFAKAANIIKYFLFGECSARLTGETVKRVGKPTLKNANDLSQVQLHVVCDTDIQGTDNVAFFRYLWEQLETKQPRANAFGIQVASSAIDLCAEQDEPILMLPDHIAGALQASAPSSAPPPQLMDVEDVANIAQSYGRLDAITMLDMEFGLTYGSIFRESRLWELIWPEDQAP